MINLSAEIQKFIFFDEEIYEANKNNDKEKNKINLKRNSIKDQKELESININNISVGGPREIYAINSMLFINGKLIHEQDSKMIRENLIMKISENEILDLYRVFNGVYYGFRYAVFKGKPLFIIIGGNFNEYMINNNLELFMLTSIKIYDATHFINTELKKYPPQNIMDPKEEPYPQILLKNIKILKRLSDSKLICTEESISMEGYESIQNINSFSINNEFTYAAISLDQGDIILLYAFPNFIECNTHSIKMIYLPKINSRDHITNLCFAKLMIYHKVKNVLYASTSKLIYFYEWENKKDGEKDIELKILNNNGPGSYNGCMDVKGRNFLMGSSNDDFIYEYENLELRKTLPFKGKKMHLFYFKDYMVIAHSDDNSSLLQIFDKKYGIFIYYKQRKEKIIGICGENNELYIIYEKSIDSKYIVKLNEIDIKLKLKKVINAKLFELAIIMTEKCKLDEKNLANILVLYADDEFNKGHYKESINLYAKTIGLIQPNEIVFKFKEKSKLEFLIIYLEKYLSNLEFKFNIHSKEYYTFTKLLLNCYILKNDLQVLKDYISKKEIFFDDEIFEYITKICFETDKIEYAISLTKKNQKYINYIKILLKLNKKEESLDFINSLIKDIDNNENEDLPDNQNDLNIQMKCEKIQAIFNYFIPYFIIEKDWDRTEKDISLEKQYFDMLSNFFDENYLNLDEKYIINILHELSNYNEYFEKLFDKLSEHPIFFDAQIFERRIELYLNENMEENKEKILSLITNSINKSIYDFDSLLFLFKFYDFIEGIELISIQRNSFKDLFFIYLNKKEHKKILNIFINNTPDEKYLWLIALHFFLSELKINLNDEEKKFFFKNALSLFLTKLLENDIFPPLYILEIIKEENYDIPLFLIQNFFLKAIEKENNNYVNKLVKKNDYEVSSQEIKDEANTLIKMPISVVIDKCHECKNKINLPTQCVVFRCKHIFHTSCLTKNKKDKKDKKNKKVKKDTIITCPKCFPEIQKVNEKLNQVNETYKNINSIEVLNDELSKHEDELEYLDELYGKGVIDYNLNK